MSAPYALVALLSIASAVVVANLVGGLRSRRRALASEAQGNASTGADDPLVDWVTELRRASEPDLRPAPPDRPAETFPGPAAAAVPTGRQPGEMSEVAAPARLPAAAQAASVRRVPPSGRGPGGAAQWLPRDVADRTSWLWPAGGHPGPSRPPGPVRPPVRRDARRPVGAPAPTAAPTRRPDVRAARPAGAGRRDWSGVLTTSPRRTLLLVGLAGVAAGLLLAGPVAAVAVGAYGTLAARALLRRQSGQLADRARRRRLDELCGLAADLRAGLPVPVAAEQLTLGRVGIPAGIGPQDAAPGDGRAANARADTLLKPLRRPAGNGPDRLERLARAAVRLADRTGAPLAELLERIEADARSTDRGLAAADAQAAGARATALLLAALPLGGIGLGYGIGVDPVAVLLHTPVGGACAVAAVGLQVAGLFWAERLGATPGRAS
ncbi:hypothetical protein [Micromonospora sp. NPDC048063]|uniref:hypothetical protein n=1 Tax=Micromonospora sp. NPDC048063 TaxID=3364256 RepID=UPI003723A0A3